MTSKCAIPRFEYRGRAAAAGIRRAAAAALLALLAAPALASAEDVIEFLGGAKVKGRVTQIDTQGKQVSFETKLGGRDFQRTYPYSKIHAVTYRGKRYVLNEKVVSATPTVGGPSSSQAPAQATKGAAQIRAVIARAGATQPDWYANTPLDYPKSLDLSWPEKPPAPWNNQKNVGQYIWDVINPNPGRWRGGVRFLHHLLSLHENDSALQQKIMLELGRMYHELLQDYARAAYWYQRVGVGQGGRFDTTRHGAHLAECYWRLGNRRMAVNLANKLPLTYALLKLWGDLGETRKCVQTAAASASKAQFPSMHYLIIGDAHRVVGEYDKALIAYEKALQLASNSSHAREEKLRVRADASLKALQSLAAIDLKRTPDGVYRASSIGYEGPVEVELRVAGNRIEETRVIKHKEKQFYSSIEDTTQKILQRQGVKGVDATSGATITSEAIINASAKALAEAAP